MKLFFKSQKGFTLIELLVVVAIIALLSSVVLASLKTARAKSRDAVRLSDIRQINNAIQLYMLGNNQTPLYNGGFQTARDNDPTWQQLQTALTPYIKTLSRDPCGLKCPGAISGNAPFYIYEYNSYGNISKTAYKIGAQALETRSGVYGINDGGRFITSLDSSSYP